MLESTPGSPYTGSIQDLLSVESNMHYRQEIRRLLLYRFLILDIRRLLARRHLNANEIPVTVTTFPRLGAPGIFTDPYFSPDGAKSSHSLFLPEEITNPHARFPSVPLFDHVSRLLSKHLAAPLPPTLEPGEAQKSLSIFLFLWMRGLQDRSLILLYRGSGRCTQKMLVRFSSR